ncbi:hypothetical protein SAMN04244572_04655 [Azotobacter beijerinckii]|uniref:Uncharacterized protein n=1 Tax=Azotobacter beijerinckii TaxID=170623 RepID=A0A1H7AH53_9GAMM|nr:hypothetical protein SAMN04244572_04655 [Azotobacter beijerinckii]
MPTPEKLRDMGASHRGIDSGLGLIHLGAALAGGHLRQCAGRIVGPGGPVLHWQRDEHPLVTASDLNRQVVGGSLPALGKLFAMRLFHAALEHRQEVRSLS